MILPIAKPEVVKPKYHFDVESDRNETKLSLMVDRVKVGWVTIKPLTSVLGILTQFFVPKEYRELGVGDAVLMKAETYLKVMSLTSLMWSIIEDHDDFLELAERHGYTRLYAYSGPLDKSLILHIKDFGNPISYSD
jgi:GNAT superfamily N-acetyltransferase